VFAVSRHGVHHVLVASQELLDESAVVHVAEAVHFASDVLHREPHLFRGRALENVVASGALDRLHDQRVDALFFFLRRRSSHARFVGNLNLKCFFFCAEEGLGVGPGAGFALAHGADAGAAHGFSHEEFVAPRRRQRGRVDARAQTQREFVRQDDARLRARHRRDDARLGGLLEDLRRDDVRKRRGVFSSSSVKRRRRCRHRALGRDGGPGRDERRDGRVGVRVHDNQVLAVLGPDSLGEDRSARVRVDDHDRAAVDGFGAHELQVQRNAFLEAVVVALQDGRVGVDELDGAGPREAVGRESGEVARLHVPLEGVVRRQLRQTRRRLVGRPHHARDARHEEDLGAELGEGGRRGRQRVELLRRRGERVQRRVHLVVPDTRPRNGRPRALAAVAAGADLDEAAVTRGLVVFHLHVRGAVGNSQRVQNAIRVRGELRRDVSRRHERHAVVHEVGAVDAALVVDPNGHDFVFAVARRRVHHVLVAGQKLLDESAGVRVAQAVRFAGRDRRHGLFHVSEGLALVDVVGAGARDRLDHHRERRRRHHPLRF